MIIKRKKIILSGGGTGGSVTPLLEIYRSLADKYDFLFVGSYHGIEKEILKKESIRYKAIMSGKWRRYFSILYFLDILKIFFAFWQSLFLIIKERPDLIISAGAFVAVPLSWAAWFLGVPIIIHQQDIIPGLANKLMSKFARIITVCFSSSLKYYGRKALLIGNLGPDLNNFLFDKDNIEKKYNIKNDKPLILVLGGGTGSLFINNIVADSITELISFSRVIHVSGKMDRSIKNYFNSDDYQRIEFLDHQDLLKIMKLADLVVSRCGLATLTELSFMSKASILIPMPNSHQEYNALEFEKKEAALVLHQKDINTNIFIEKIKYVFSNKEIKENLENNISQVIKKGNKKMIELVDEIL